MSRLFNSHYLELPLKNNHGSQVKPGIQVIAPDYASHPDKPQDLPTNPRKLRSAGK